MSIEAIHPSRDPAEFWEVHEDPKRPLDPYAILCACIDCTAALISHGEQAPRSSIALKTNCDRIVVTAEYLASVRARDRSLSPLFYVPDDWLRSIYLPSGPPLPMQQRWWSLTCQEDDIAAGHRPRLHRVAKRQSRAALERRRAAARSFANPKRQWPLVALADAIAPARKEQQRLLAAVAQWTLAKGTPLDRDVLALILAAIDCGTREVTATRWTRTGVNHVLSIDVFNWCGLRAVLIPEGVPETIWLYLSYLYESGRLDAASDPIAELRKPLLCYGGLDQSGRRRQDDARREAPCECYVTYRGPRHGDRR